MEENKDIDFTDLESFKKLEERLNQARRYRENNLKRINMLQSDLKRVRGHMDDVNRHQNQAIHKVMLGRRN